MIQYQDSIANRGSEKLDGFFVGWAKPPTLQKRRQVLQQSDFVLLAIDSETDKMVGFITAITDGLFAYIPLLEVLPDYKGRGIGKTLVKKMLGKLKDLYSVDLLCDPSLQSFYTECSMTKMTGMTLKNYQY